jgi:hypothetical protein
VAEEEWVGCHLDRGGVGEQSEGEEEDDEPASCPHEALLTLNRALPARPSPHLRVNDARTVADALRGFGFRESSRLRMRRATAREIRWLLGGELPRRVKKTDRVIVFFAGHGAHP